MDEIRIDIGEKQLDALAGRIAALERKFDGFLALLSGDAVATRLGLDKAAIKSVGRESIASATAELRHHNERARMIKEAERDDLASRLDFVRRELGRVASPATRVRRSDTRARRKPPVA